ncbi:MAG: hypothetical protein GX628_06595 [Clostridiales bacterium]|nr:hypothetical protein [Clostridiales bacterium]
MAHECAYAYGIRPDGSRAELEVKLTADGNVTTAVIAASSVTEKFKYVDLMPDYFTASEGEAGYIVSSRNTLTYFKGHEDCETGLGFIMPMFGAKTPRVCFCAYAVSMKYDMQGVIRVKDGKYTVFARFMTDCVIPDEDMAVKYHLLEGADADYSGIAREYRKYRLSDGCVPIAERAGEILKYTAESVYVRIRCGWKPVPTPVEEQTVENEPPMHVAVDFKRVGEIMDAFKARGIEKAEFCLVGWNIRGHDGRWPQALPVEPALGGEEGLRALIAKAKSMDYALVCHTNATDAYRIADCFSEDYTIKNSDGSPQRGGSWSGGMMYNTCPLAAKPIYLKTHDDLRDLGFRGTHYIDVISTVPARRCFDPEHPLTRTEWVKHTREIMRDAAEKIGGISSEGCFDHMSGDLDYGLYTVFAGTKKSPLTDEYVPIWQLVYNGIITSNPSSDTVNASLKEPEVYLEVAEFNGRPSFYYYSRFVDDPTGKRGNWMGEADLTCADFAELAHGVDCVGRVYDEYKERCRLQYCFMERHDIVAKGVVRVTYSDGTRIYVNRTATGFEADGKTIPAGSWKTVNP